MYDLFVLIQIAPDEKARQLDRYFIGGLIPDARRDLMCKRIALG
jgi:hypothetical protein